MPSSERAVSLLGQFLSQLRAKTAQMHVFGRSCVTFGAKTVTAKQVRLEKAQKAEAFKYICIQIERCGVRSKRKHV
jgi:hypothetical protein